jgi:hypothetical protein
VPTRCGAGRHADLSAFDPAVRLEGGSNGEGVRVVLAGVDASAPLERRHPAVLAAAELGLPHSALLRNLANSALRRWAAAAPGLRAAWTEAAHSRRRLDTCMQLGLWARDCHPCLCAPRRAARAGNPRALLPSLPYVSPPDVAAAAAFEVLEEAGAFEDGPEAADAWERAEAAAAATQEPITGLPPVALQLPVPPQLPLYYSALMQHERVGPLRASQEACRRP